MAELSNDSHDCPVHGEGLPDGEDDKAWVFYSIIC